MATMVIGGLTAQAAADTPDVLDVDFAARTGDFRGGASGTLYGFGDDGVPTQALVNGARITNSSQKPPYGTQHPSGDALRIEEGFFAKHGEDLAVYVQDHYPDWPYYGAVRPGDTRTYNQADGTYTSEPNGVWDYLEVVEMVAEMVATGSDHPEKYLFVPFNEPDLMWYQNWSAMRATFLADWKAVHSTIQEVYARHGLGHARVGGPGDSRWHGGRSRDFLTFAQADGVLPDVFIWHELGIDNLSSFRSNFHAYRALERELGIPETPVNITEWGMLRDMGVPGQLIQWFSLFESTKVEAQTAYWNYAGNFSDNSARVNGANGGWWMFKWYGDLAGSETVQVTPPRIDTADTLQGIAAIDDEQARATVLFGGTENDVRLDLTGLDPATFGSRVDIEVREVRLTGAQGLAGTPPVVLAHDGVELAGGIELSVPVADRYSGYQVLITPERSRPVAESPVWSITTEAENTDLTDATVYFQDPRSNGGWKFLASGSRDVGSFNRPTSRAEWTVEVPRDGTYRLQVIGGTPGVPGRHALFVDGELDQIVQYTADLALTSNHRWQYRGSTEVLLDLSQGRHVLSLRASADGSSLLPNADITLDRLVLTDVTDGEPTNYPAATLRYAGGAALLWEDDPRGLGQIRGTGARADVYAATFESGYYDLAVSYRTDDASDLQVSVNGRRLVDEPVAGPGAWTSTARVHLAEGINEIEIESSGGVLLDVVTTTRAAEADDARVTVEAESGSVGGAARVAALADHTGTNASGGAIVDYIGDGSENYLEIERRAGFAEPGQYDVVVHFSNAELSGDHDYNPQVVDRRLDILEAGTPEPVASAHFRYTFSWHSFWERTVPVTLTTGDGALRLTNPDAYAPNIDKIVVAPAVLGQVSTVRKDEAVVSVEADTRCVVGRVVVVARVANLSPDPADLVITSTHGTRTTALPADGTASVAFSTREPSVPAGEISVTVDAGPGGTTVTAPYAPGTCR